MLRTYADTLDYLYAHLPMFQRIGAAALKPDLANTLALCAAVGNPERSFKSIHIAGTNGKGSTSHMVASIMQAAGYKTGLYTSPHLKQFTERIRVNGSEVSQQFVIDFVNRIRPTIEEVKPSFFEVTVAMAFDYYRSLEVDVAIIEVGLGGRLDSTNVITPELSIITNIGWDHKDILGDTLEKIAFEKAGIIKPHIDVVVSERQPGIDKVFTDRAAALEAPITFAADTYHADTTNNAGTVAMTVTKNGKPFMHNLVLPLQGFYQRKNIGGVLMAVDKLRAKGWNITDTALIDGLQQVVARTGLKGRWQVLGRAPLIVCDTGHNVDGMGEVVAQIQAQTYEQLFMVVGMVKDKDIAAVLQLLPREAHYYFCQAAIPRAMAAEQLQQQAAAAGLRGEVIHDVNAAIAAARARASGNDLIFIGGSTFVVAEINGL